MRSVFAKQIAWLCLLLTVSAAFSFAAHHHSNPSDEIQCTICLVAHCSAPVATINLSSALLLLVPLVIPAEPVSAKQRLVPFALTVRPPPVS